MRQLRRLWAKDGNLSSHVFVSIVRLTVETNLITSKDLQGFDVIMCNSWLTLVQPLPVS